MRGEYLFSLMICYIGIQSIHGEFHRRFLFRGSKTADNQRDITDNDSTIKSQKTENLSRLLEQFLSANKKSDQSPSNDNDKFNKLFQIVNRFTKDKQKGDDVSPSSSSKLTRLMKLLQNQDASSSKNLQLVPKVLSLLQGKTSLDSFTFDELKSLSKIFG